MVSVYTDQLVLLNDTVTHPQVCLHTARTCTTAATFIHPGADVTPPRCRVNRDRLTCAAGNRNKPILTSTSTSTPLQLSCDSSSQTDFESPMQDALSPTQMPPTKRHRRSASIPGGTRSENCTHRRTSRHRQSTGILHPLAVRLDAVAASPAVLVPLTASSQNAGFGPSTFQYAADNRLNCDFTFSGTNFIRPRGVVSPSLELPMHLLSFNTDGSGSASAAVMLSRPASTIGGICMSAACERSAVAPVSMQERTGVGGGIAAADAAARADKFSQLSVPVPRCRSQPGALLSRAGSLKRRREECRPRLDFLKMRETAYDADLSESYAHSRSSTFLSVFSSDILPDKLANDSTDQPTDTDFHSWRPCKETRRSTTPLLEDDNDKAPCAATWNLPDADRQSPPPVIADICFLPGGSDDGDDVDEELVTINDKCLGGKPVEVLTPFATGRSTDDDENGASSAGESSTSLTGEIDLELIERN